MAEWTKERHEAAKETIDRYDKTDGMTHEEGFDFASNLVDELQNALAEIERLQKALIPAHWDAEEREQAEIALSGAPESIVEAHCQQCLERALLEIGRLQARKHKLIIIGYTGLRAAYLDISKEDAVKRAIKSGHYHEKTQIDEFEFTDEFGAYDCWEI